MSGDARQWQRKNATPQMSELIHSARSGDHQEGIPKGFLKEVLPIIVEGLSKEILSFFKAFRDSYSCLKALPTVYILLALTTAFLRVYFLFLSGA